MRHYLLLSALLGLSLVQCSSSQSNPAPLNPDSTSFCLHWAQAQCSTKVVSSCLASSTEVCVANRQGVCETSIVGPALDAHLVYDASKADGCIAQVHEAYKDAIISNTDEAAITKACELVFSGTEARGASCTTNAECKQSEGLQCIIHYKASFADAGDITGTCQVPATPAVAGGASCTEPDQQCASGYHCGSTSHCDQDEPLGNTCSLQDPCVSSATCLGGTCVAKSGTGDTCTTDADCTSGYCVEKVNLCAETYVLSQGEPFCTPMHS